MPHKTITCWLKVAPATVLQRDGDNLGGEHEIGAYCAFHLALLIGRSVLIGAGPVRSFHLRRLAVAQAVKHLFEPFVAQVGTAHHQQRRNRPGCKSADQQRQRHQDRLVDQRTFGDAPHHRQFAIGFNAGDLLRVERQIVPSTPAVFAAILLINETSSNNEAMSSMRVSKLLPAKMIHPFHIHGPFYV